MGAIYMHMNLLVYLSTVCYKITTPIEGNAAFETAVLCLIESISYYGVLLAANGGEDLPNLALDGGKVWLVSATKDKAAAESIHDSRLYRWSSGVFPRCYISSFTSLKRGLLRDAEPYSGMFTLSSGLLTLSSG